MTIVEGVLTDETDAGVEELYGHISGENVLPLFSGALQLENGIIQQENVAVINARSLAEEVRISDINGLITGRVDVVNGKPENLDIIFEGKSLVHSAPLTAIAFTKSFFGDYGKYIVSIGLLLFAFSTAISWSYYGDRAMTYLFGPKSVKYYRMVYVGAFFIASFADTTIIWTLSGITIAVMTLPNLFGILMLRKDMKSTLADYWKSFKEEWPDEKSPE